MRILSLFGLDRLGGTGCGLCRSALDHDLVDAHWCCGPVPEAFRHARDLLHKLDAGVVALAEDGVVSVQPGRGLLGDEELRSVGSGPGIGHGQPPRTVEGQRGRDLIREFVPGIARARAQRVSALDHELGDHAMEDGSAVGRYAVLLWDKVMG
jgi:hypothetical protein